MTTFLDLPAELRLMVYAYAFRGRRVKFVRGLKKDAEILRRADSASLLLSSKTIYLEARSLFFQIVRIDPTSIIDGKTGVVQCAESTSPAVTIGAATIKPDLLQRVKIHQDVFASTGGRVFVKALKNLRSLTYHCKHPVYIEEECVIESMADSCDSDYHCGCCCDCTSPTSTAYQEAFISMVKYEVDEEHYLITGKCCNPGSDRYSMGAECDGENPIRGFIAGWAWRDKPFQLIVQVDFKISTQASVEMVSIHRPTCC